MQPERGIALLIVVSILTVIAIMAVSFMFSMHLEIQASRQFSGTAAARYASEAGIAVARAFLDEDRLGSRIDHLGESWAKQFLGSETDVDSRGSADARWWLIADPAGDTVGRYAVLVKDENSKVNLNTALADPSASGVNAVNLTRLLSRLGMADPAGLASAIERYRYGPDGKPGVAQVDDDRNGAVDDPGEYQVLVLRGDDRRFESLEELLGIGGLDAASLKLLAKVATVYSWDSNLSLTGTPRLNVNTATADEILAVLLEAGVDDPWQMAVNMADYVDRDLDMSRVSKVAVRYNIPNQEKLGDWSWEAGSGGNPGHYVTEVADGQPLVWQLSVPAANFRVLVHGVPGIKVGDVELEGQSKPSMNSGESFGVLPLSGTITVRVGDHEPAGTRCAFQGLELVPTDPSSSGITPVMVRGVEAIRFNELMVAPRIELPVSQAVFDPQTSGWTCPGGGSCSNSGVGQARWSWTNPAVRPGHYYVRVYGAQPGQTVGEVRVDGNAAKLVHGELHPQPITVGQDQKISLTIGKTPSDGTYYFQSAILSLEPDAEYVELINLSDKEIDVTGWVIEGEATGGRQARLPLGSVVAAHGLLVAAVDLNDTQPGLDGNGIDARSAWEIPQDATCVQLEFPGGALTPESAWLSTTLPSGTTARLVLRANEWTVDETEYPVPLTTQAPFQSLEKGDPGVVRDTNRNGIDEGWYPALKLYTPGAANDNEGLRELRGLEQIVHDPAKEITILNRPLKSVGELAGLPSGIPWHVVASDDLANVVDRLTVEGMTLETAGHLSDGQDAWHETTEGYETSRQGAEGTWQWKDVPDGQYHLSVYGWTAEQLSVRWQLKDSNYSDWIPTRSTDAQGRIVVGQVPVGLDQAPSKTLTLQVRCDSAGGVCHVNRIALDPQLTLVGVININTAPLDVLMSLPGMTDAIAQRIMANRPFGDQEHKARGIGDLLLGATLGDTETDKLERFRQMAHLITVRSQVFQIFSVGEALEHDKPTASQRIQAIVQR